MSRKPQAVPESARALTLAWYATERFVPTGDKKIWLAIRRWEQAKPRHRPASQQDVRARNVDRRRPRARRNRGVAGNGRATSHGGNLPGRGHRPNLLHQLAAFLFAVKRKDWAAARGGLSGAGRIVDRMRRDEPAEVAPEQNWQCGVYTQIDAAVRSIQAGDCALAAGELNGAVALLLHHSRACCAAES